MIRSVVRSLSPKQLGLCAFGLMVGLLLPLATGCPGSLEGNWPPATGTGSGGSSGSGGAGGSLGFCDAPNQVFKNPTNLCFGCHPANLTTPPDLATPVVTGNSVSASSTCQGMPFIDRTTPANSVLVKRVMGTSCGPQMPILGFTLSAADQACVLDWAMHQ